VFLRNLNWFQAPNYPQKKNGALSDVKFLPDFSQCGHTNERFLFSGSGGHELPPALAGGQAINFNFGL
jgi:hypothetical protein